LTICRPISNLGTAPSEGRTRKDVIPTVGVSNPGSRLAQPTEVMKRVKQTTSLVNLAMDISLVPP
jgi:hypothetical protein